MSRSNPPAASGGPSPTVIALMVLIAILGSVGALYFLSGDPPNEADPTQEAPANPFEDLPPEERSSDK